VADDAKQIDRGFFDLLQIVPLYRRQNLACLLQRQAGEAENRVEWRPEFMRHAGEEGRLVLGRAPHLAVLLLQLYPLGGELAIRVGELNGSFLHATLEGTRKDFDFGEALGVLQRSAS